MAKRQKVTRARGLDAAIKALSTQYGKTPLFATKPRRFIPMRHAALGCLLGGLDHPGVPTGTFIEVVGNAHSGKTSTTFAFIDAIINQPDDQHPIHTDAGIEYIPVPRRVLFVDFEQMLDLRYLDGSVRNVRLAQTDTNGRLINADDANVFVHQPDNLNAGTDVAIEMMRSFEFGLVIIDSVAAMLPSEEAEKSMTQNTVGLQAREIGKLLRKTSPLVRQTGCVFVFINQWRDKIGVSFGDPRTTPGGRALEFYDAIKLDVSGSKRTPWFDHGKTVNIKSTKNKVWGTKGSVTYHLRDGWGLSAEVELAEALLAYGVITNSSHKRPVMVLPKKANGRLRCKHKWDTMPEFLEAIRTRPALYESLVKAAIRRGYSPGKAMTLASSRPNGGLEI